MLRAPDGMVPAARSRLVLEQAAAALNAGDAGDAERLLRKHLLEQPTDAAALSKLAELAVQQLHVEEATALLRRAVGADPTPARQLALILHLQRFVGAKFALRELEALPAAIAWASARIASRSKPNAGSDAAAGVWRTWSSTRAGLITAHKAAKASAGIAAQRATYQP